MSKRRHNFGTKRFKEKSLFIFHARIALKSLILLFVRLIARGARIGKTHTQTDRQTHRQTDRTSTVTLAHARRGLMKSTEAPDYELCSLHTNCNNFQSRSSDRTLHNWSGHWMGFCCSLVGLSFSKYSNSVFNFCNSYPL